MRPPLASSAVAVLVAVGLGITVVAAPDGFWPPDANDLVRRLPKRSGSTLVEVVPAKGRDLLVMGAMRTVAPDERLVASVRRVQHLQHGRYFPVARRFSDPPVLDDLSDLVLEEGDLQDIRRCRPGNCGLKLSAAEITRLRQIVPAAGREWRPAVQEQFREIVLMRARAFLAAGHAGIADTHDHKRPESPGAEFAAVLASAGLAEVHEGMARYLADYPRASVDGIESFLFWSKETHSGAKPIIAVTHVSIALSHEGTRPPVLVASAQVFATHYLTASLSLIASSGEGEERYLLYRRRSRADVFDGMFGGLVRRMVEGRVRAEAPVALAGLRARLEAEAPPASAALR